MFYDAWEGVYMKGSRCLGFFHKVWRFPRFKEGKRKINQVTAYKTSPRNSSRESKSRKVAFKENLRQNVKYLIFRIFSPFKWRPGRHSKLRSHKIPLKWILMLSATCHESWNMRTMFKLFYFRRSFFNPDALSNVHNFTTFVLFANAAHRV